MKEFPHHQFSIVNKFQQSVLTSTYAVKPHIGAKKPLILKLYSGPSARLRLQALENDFLWQNGLIHPHLLGIEAVGISGKTSFFTTRQLLNSTLDLAEANSSHIQQVLDGVCFLHKHARFHGRLKPSNIFIVDGRVCLADLWVMDRVGLSGIDDIRFTAPEVLAGGVPTVESDYYSLGAILYRVYARRDPFDDSFPENLAAKYLHVKIPSIRNIDGVREPVARAIDGLLHRNPRHRSTAFGELIREFPFKSVCVSRVPVVGRRDTIEILHSQAFSKTTGLTVSMIEGDAGIGKSRLLEELKFTSDIRNSETYISSCLHSAERSLAPITKLVKVALQQRCMGKQFGMRHLLGSFADNLEPLLEGSPEEYPGDGIIHPMERIIQELIGLISSLSGTGSLRLGIEDIDRAEPATMEFLKQICYRASELNVRLILTCRNSSALPLLREMESMLGSRFTRLRLEPLTKSESRDLIRYLESDIEKQAQLLNHADGNPLWLQLHARNENNQELVASIHKLIHEEMAGHSRKLVQALAVYKAPATAELLARVVSMDIEQVRQKLLWLKNIGAVHESNQAFEMRMDGLRSVIESDFSKGAQRATHKALYAALRSAPGVAEERLAELAFYGGLWNQAAVHFAGLARNAAKRRDNVSALNHYGKLKKILAKLNQGLPLEAESDIAICLARTGKTEKAGLAFQRLLTESNINEEVRLRLALLSSGAQVDRTYLDQRLNLLREAIESSRCGEIHPSVFLSQLAGCFVISGEFDSALEAVERAQLTLRELPDKDGQVILRGAEGFLAMNMGKFRVASEIYRALPSDTWDMAAAVLTNRGVCLEHLGSIRAALVIQKRAYRFATKANHLVGQFLCLGNLGVFNTKLGNFKEARGYFGQMKCLMTEVGSTVGISYKGVEAEDALLELWEGRYHAALQHLRAALNSAALLKSMRYQCLLLECEIQFLLGADIKTADVENIADEGSWSNSPLYASQLALFRSRTKSSINEGLSVLKAGLSTAKEASLLYESCRLELEISAKLQETDPDQAKVHAEETIRIAKKNGYRPLQARALLLRGLCSRHNKERKHYLEQSFNLASDIGIPEIVSESAYHLGILNRSMGQFPAAREFFATSTRVTSEISGQMPGRFRSGYLSKDWRRDARRLYAEYLQDQPVKLPSFESQASLRERHFLRALYRISISAASAQTVDAFLLELTSSIARSRDGIVVVVKSGGNTTWHALGITLTEELRQRVLSMSNQARNQARFNSQYRWIPFQSAQYSGGIYVLNRKRNEMGEDEMEFFTILGTFVSSALDQINNRAVSWIGPASIDGFHGIVGTSPKIREMCVRIETISNNNSTVLIQGETGTGKELVARAIHKLSARTKAPFVAIDCGAISEGLIESELFGSKRGSFTDAIADRAGVFEAAHRGSLFLDEISNMNLGMQAKLLRVLQEREIRRVGETRSRPIDVRLIAASNTNLQKLVAEGLFRQDLLFRLNVMDVHIPPLRARRDDIPELAAHFLNQLNAVHNAGKVFGREALHPLLAHSFPGNVRELQNAIERSFFSTSGRIISSIPIESLSSDDSADEVRRWLADLAEGRKNFWTAIHDRYKSRDIPREKVVALIDLGLRATKGSYKNLASLLHIDPREYRRFMDFLRRNNCLLDFRPYRKMASLS